MNENKQYDKSLDMLFSYCDLLKDREKARLIRTGNDNLKCYIVTADGEKWVKLEQLGTKMKNLLGDVAKEVLELKSTNNYLRKELTQR